MGGDGWSAESLEGDEGCAGSWRSLASELWRHGLCSQFPRIETLTISGKLTMMAQRVGRASGAGARTGVGGPQ